MLVKGSINFPSLILFSIDFLTAFFTKFLIGKDNCIISEINAKCDKEAKFSVFFSSIKKRIEFSKSSSLLNFTEASENKVLTNHFSLILLLKFEMILPISAYGRFFGLVDLNKNLENDEIMKFYLF